jgi:hypothetical protein
MANVKPKRERFKQRNIGQLGINPEPQQVSFIQQGLDSGESYILGLKDAG